MTHQAHYSQSPSSSLSSACPSLMAILLMCCCMCSSLIMCSLARGALCAKLRCDLRYLSPPLNKLNHKVLLQSGAVLLRRCTLFFGVKACGLYTCLDICNGCRPMFVDRWVFGFVHSRPNSFHYLPAYINLRDWFVFCARSLIVGCCKCPLVLYAKAQLRIRRLNGVATEMPVATQPIDSMAAH